MISGDSPPILHNPNIRLPHAVQEVMSKIGSEAEIKGKKPLNPVTRFRNRRIPLHVAQKPIASA